MRVCIICGEEYEEVYSECPYCGCPEDYKIHSKQEFPEQFSRRYSLMPIGNHLKMNETEIFWDNEKQRVIAAGILIADECGNRMLNQLRTIQQCGYLDMFPEILEIYEPNGVINGYYIYEKPEGLSLGRMVERRNPLAESEVQLIEKELERICAEWQSHKISHGCLDLNNIWLSDGKIQIADFGNNPYTEDDWQAVKRICARLRNGFWLEEEQSGKKKGIAKFLSLRREKRTYGN